MKPIEKEPSETKEAYKERQKRALAYKEIAKDKERAEFIKASALDAARNGLA